MIDPALLRTLDGLFRAGDRDDSRAELWQTLIEHGFVHPFAHGATRWSEGAAIIAATSRHAPGFALAENIAASFLLARAKHELGPHRLTLADPLHSALELRGTVAFGTLAHVPHAAVSSHVLANARRDDGRLELVCVELRGAEGASALNAAGEPRDRLTLREAPACALGREPDELLRSSLLLVGALMRATQIAAMGESVLELVLEYAKARIQFGRPIAEHQAVEQMLAELACDVALATTAVRFAEARIDAAEGLDDEASWRAVMQAKLLGAKLAETSIRVGHAVLGAIGFTEEHPLARFTSRLMSYPAELGSARTLAEALGASIVAGGRERLWTDLVRLSE